MRDPAPEYSSATEVLCIEETKAHAFCDSVAPDYSGEAKCMRISYASRKQEKYEESLTFIPFMNVRLQAASLKTFQSP